MIPRLLNCFVTAVLIPCLFAQEAAAFRRMYSPNSFESRGGFEKEALAARGAVFSRDVLTRQTAIRTFRAIQRIDFLTPVAAGIGAYLVPLSKAIPLRLSTAGLATILGFLFQLRGHRFWPLAASVEDHNGPSDAFPPTLSARDGKTTVRKRVKERSIKQQLSELIQAALAVDPISPDPDALLALESKLAAFRGGNFKVPATTRGKYFVTPRHHNTLYFNGLTPGKIYLLQPYWEPGFGFRLYFVGENKTLGYDVENYGRAHPTVERHTFMAHLQVRGQDLATARRSRKELVLPVMVLAALALNPVKPDAQALVDLENRLAAFRAQDIQVTATSNSEFNVSPLRDRPLRFIGLTPGETYSLQPYWEPGFGFRLYFVGEKETLGYDIEKYRKITPDGKYKVIWAHLQVRARNLETARHSRKELLRPSLILAALALDPFKPDSKALADLKGRLATFNGHNFEISASPSGLRTIPLLKNQPLHFQGLTPNEVYTVYFYWEEGLGPYFYFVGQHETLIYDPKNYRNALSQRDAYKWVAHLQIRSEDVEAAREHLRNREYWRRMGWRSLVLRYVFDPSAAERIETLDKNPELSVQTSELTHKVAEILDGHRYTPEQVGWLLEIGELIAGGLSLEEALTESDVAVDHQAWIRHQWTEVLPSVLKPLKSFVSSERQSGFVLLEFVMVSMGVTLGVMWTASAPATAEFFHGILPALAMTSFIAISSLVFPDLWAWLLGPIFNRPAIFYTRPSVIIRAA